MTVESDGSSLENMVATVLDVCVAVPTALTVYCVFMPLVAMGTGIVRGLSELHAYAEGKRGLRLLAPHYARDQRRLEAMVRPFRETAQPHERIYRDDG